MPNFLTGRVWGRGPSGRELAGSGRGTRPLGNDARFQRDRRGKRLGAKGVDNSDLDEGSKVKARQVPGPRRGKG